MKWKNNILNLKAYTPGRTIDEVKKTYGLEQVTKLASNENPYGSSSSVREAILAASSNYALYPDGSATLLKEALAEHIGLPKEQVILGNGSDEIIAMIARALLKPGVNTVMATPTFSQYKHNAIVENAEIREVILQDGKHDLEAMLAAIDENTAVVWVCTPNNPTGVYIPESELVQFLNQVPADVLVVLDEAYAEYVVAEDYPNSTTLLNKHSNLIILRTFSKIYGLASFRVGYGIATKEVVAKLEPIREPFNVNSLAQVIAAVALSDQDFVKDCSAKNRVGMQQYYDFCNEEGLFYYPSQGNFILIDMSVDSDEVFQYLMSKGYIIRSGKALGFPTFIRVTIGTEEQNANIIAEIRTYLASTQKSKVKS
ncbi:histidinol-phosphate transaminase [Bacillus massiliigorillae]|uniref:histidinol-phosphate transaminase n=1 Tax=Bacillus massiliigorillae TaxID=1243664 RepID=UPI0003A2D294|nr:histidinol-phosphate transaminase [Bacillus massiliigorillae]